jgi:hypothetical protein
MPPAQTERAGSDCRARQRLFGDDVRGTFFTEKYHFAATIGCLKSIIIYSTDAT